MNLLAHVCCASCWLACAPRWDQAVGPTGRWQGFFSNPNIHPFIEFRRRLKAVRMVADDCGWPLVAEEGYGLRRFLEEVDWRGEDCCGDCYRLRLGATAAEAQRAGCDHFTTTLLASTHQDHERIRSIGEEVGQRFGVAFFAEDWRAVAESGHAEARRRSLYRQQYCGCIFSEYERYRASGLHLYRGRDGRSSSPQPSPAEGVSRPGRNARPTRS